MQKELLPLQCLLLAVVLSCGAGVWARQPATDDAAAAEAPTVGDAAGAGEPAAAADELSLAQEQVAARYKRFEEVLLRMAELSAGTDPKRAALLRKAVAESKNKLIGVQLEQLVELLRQDRLANAVSGQQQVEKELAKLLELLLSEERGRRLKDEKQRLKEQIQRLKELINKQQQLQGQTAGGGNLNRLADGQGKLQQQTGELAKDMRNQQGPNAGDAESGEEAPGDEKPGDDKSGEEGNQGNQPSPADDKPTDTEKGAGGESKGKPGDQGQGGNQEEGQESQQGQQQNQGQGQNQGQSQGHQGDQQQQDGQQQDANSSARQRVEAARQRMEQARQKLEQAKREGAVQEQEEAIRELERAKAELEEVLRQLREEEMERVLAMLEARFRKMLEMQRDVYEGTLRLDKVGQADRGRDEEIEAGRLSRKEALIVVEVDAALSLLKEEGSAVAFPEAIEQMREDMQQVVTWLAQAKVGEMTQAIEEEIIAALEEMIEALQKAQQDLEQQQQQQQPPGEPQEPPLVDKLAEIKMIRALQVRVNNRTQRYSKQVEGEIGQAETAELLEALRQLSRREARIHRATRDIVVGKNQ